MPEALNLTILRERLRKGLGGRDDTDLPNDEVDLLLNLSLWDIADRFWFKEKECIVTAQLTPGLGRYEVPDPLDAIHSISYVIQTTGEYRKVLQIDMDTYESMHTKSADASTWGPPKRYTRFKDIIYLTPIPDKDYTLRMACWKTVASLAEGSVDTIGLPRNWHELVIEGAITRGHYYNEDYNLARQSENFRVGKERAAILVKDKEGRDNRFARLVPLTEWPEEGNL